MQLFINNFYWYYGTLYGFRIYGFRNDNDNSRKYINEFKLKLQI